MISSRLEYGEKQTERLVRLMAEVGELIYKLQSLLLFITLLLQSLQRFIRDMAEETLNNDTDVVEQEELEDFEIFDTKDLILVITYSIMSLGNCSIIIFTRR